MCLVDDERAELSGRTLVLEGGGDLEVCETDHAPVDVRDEHTIPDDRQPLEACRDGTRLRRIAELIEEAGDLRRIVRTCVPDGQIHGSRLRTRAR